ncbi:STAS domain-containing protein [Mycolicibacterium palauense]|uniref:STAS domain-containing protein n=1 Tax=Mycolicibacterium palauense TaxID=2034511 RepID=UPI00159BE362|nr:STAS domain-containing protein [Mycolicibacterium palauense]
MTASTAVAQRPAASAPRTIRTIDLPQRFDVHEVAEFHSAIDRAVAPGTDVVVDASQVRYLDRSGMDALIQARLRCIDHGGDLTLAGPSVAARVILELSGHYEALNPADAVSGRRPTAVRAA